MAPLKPQTPAQSGRYVAAVDIGTTSIRCCLIDDRGCIVSFANRPIELLQPFRGIAEICPESIWRDFKLVVQETLYGIGCNGACIDSLGISVQRGTFTTWDRNIGEPLHNFITWKDRRCDSLCKHWNNSFRLRSLRAGALFGYTFSRSQRLLGASQYRLKPALAVARLLWVLENISEARNCLREGNLQFGTLDTYLVWRLTGRRVFATDPSNASATGMFDVYKISWSNMLLRTFGLPKTMLPEVRDTSGYFGHTDPDIFGAAIPICSVVGDQSSSMFGHGCFEAGDIKCTLGTGTFINLNTGSRASGSFKNGMYPVVGWSFEGKPTYLMEMSFFDSATTVNFAVDNLKLAAKVGDLSRIAASATPVPELCFIPAFTGLQTPENDCSAAPLLIGLTAQTSRAQILNSVLRSIAFSTHQLLHTLQKEFGRTSTQLSVDGGISQCDFILRTISDLQAVPVVRKLSPETSAVGAAFLSGLSTGFFTSLAELNEMNPTKEVIHAKPDKDTEDAFKTWLRASKRSRNWFSREIGAQ